MRKCLKISNMVKAKKRIPNKKNFEDYPKVDYSKIFSRCIDDCKKWKIPISSRIHKVVKFTKRSDCYALCELMDSGYYQISYTSAGFDEYGINEEALYNLFMHELCHTIKGCFNHLKKWKSWVAILNEHGCKINPYPYSSKRKEFKDFY